MAPEAIPQPLGIAGLGLMGASLGLALARRGVRRIGYDPDAAAADTALHRGAVDALVPDFETLCREVPFLVLAAPAGAIPEQLRAMRAFPRLPAHVMDVGSVKRPVVEAMAPLPESVSPLGGHPMAGREVAGPGGAQAELFVGRPFVVTPLSRTRRETLEAARALVGAVGARWTRMDPEGHDRAAARISHAPYLCALALAEEVMEARDPLWARLAAGGFRDLTRVAASPASMMADVLHANRDEVREAVASLRARLDRWLQDLEDRPRLSRRAGRAASWRRTLEAGDPGPHS